jgi:hypothetical protein
MYLGRSTCDTVRIGAFVEQPISRLDSAASATNLFRVRILNAQSNESPPQSSPHRRRRILQSTGSQPYFGASSNSYSSLYLWRHDGAFRSFLDERLKAVTDSFGRPQIHTQFALDARRGSARSARFAYRYRAEIPVDADLNTAYADEISRNRASAARPGVMVAAVGVDTRDWQFTRVLLSERELTGTQIGTPFQILHLAQPLLEALPQV